MASYDFVPYALTGLSAAMQTPARAARASTHVTRADRATTRAAPTTAEQDVTLYRARRRARRRPRPDRPALSAARQHERRRDLPRAHRVRPAGAAVGVQRPHAGRPDARVARPRRVRARRGRVGARPGRAAADHVGPRRAAAAARLAVGLGPRAGGERERLAAAPGSRRPTRRSTSRGCSPRAC